MKQTKVQLGPDLLEWLKLEAIRRHCSVAQVMRDLIIAERERRVDLDKLVSFGGKNAS